jgi:hypothetical protein
MDKVGYYSVTVLVNGNYVVMSALWHKNAAANVGAATWGNGAAGVKGTVSATNSLVGSAADDYAGSMVTALSNGNYVVASPLAAKGGNRRHHHTRRGRGLRHGSHGGPDYRRQQRAWRSRKRWQKVTSLCYHFPRSDLAE